MQSNAHRTRAGRLAARSTPWLSAAAVLAVTAVAAACATTPPPTEQLAVSSAAVAHAAAAGSQQGAPAELAQARDKLRRAQQALATQDNQRALRLAQQAHVDALLAEARTETAKARQAAQDVQAADRALREEMNRKTP